MHDIIEHYGKVIIALGAIAAAATILIAVVKQVGSKTTKSVNGINYENQINDAAANAAGQSSTITPEGK